MKNPTIYSRRLSLTFRPYKSLRGDPLPKSEAPWACSPRQSLEGPLLRWHIAALSYISIFHRCHCCGVCLLCAFFFCKDGRGELHPSSFLTSRRVHLKISVVIAEASYSEAGRPRVRAWEHSHVGAAHRVGLEGERLGLLAFCDPSQVGLRAVNDGSFGSLIG